MPVPLRKQTLPLDQALVFAILAGAMALFVWNLISCDLAAMVSGIVLADRAFAGFGATRS